MNENQLFILLQVNDALFPIGGYSHSYGLETYIQKNIVNSGETALAFMKSSIKNSFLYIILRFQFHILHIFHDVTQQ